MMRGRVAAGLALIGGLAMAAGGASPARAAALCGGPPPVIQFEFAPGSAALPADAAETEGREIRALVGSSELAGYSLLAMGDIQGGAAWEGASTAERLADQRLAQARGAAVRRLLDRLPRDLRARHVSARLMPNRGVVERRLEARGLRPSSRAGVIVEIGVRHRDANGVYLAC